MSGHRVPLRCPGNTWGVAVDGSGALEVRCTDRFCRTASGRPVLHTFDLASGSFATRLADEEPVRAEEHSHAGNPTV